MADEDGNAEDANADKAGGKSSVLGPLLALLGVFVIGAILVFGVYRLLAGGGPTEESAAQETLERQQPLINRAQPLSLGDVMVNVRGEGGRRYVKVTVELWYRNEFRNQVTREEIRNRLIKAAEQRLASFDMQELGSDFIHETMARTFLDQINKELRNIYGTVGTDTTYVEEVVLTNLLVQ